MYMIFIWFYLVLIWFNSVLIWFNGVINVLIWFLQCFLCCFVWFYVALSCLMVFNMVLYGFSWFT